jgi:salicylate hydroxylase
MKSVVCPAAWKEVRLWDTGRSWKLFDLGRDSIERFHAPYWFVHRGDLHRVLREAELDAGVEINAKCESFEQDESGVTLKLVDGRETRGDVRKPDVGAHAPAVAMINPTK